MEDISNNVKEIEYIEFSNCSNGLGVKLIGGCKDNKCLNQYFGIYIRKLLPHGLACLDGRLKVSDQIREINGEDIQSQDKSIIIGKLQKAAFTNHVILGIVNNCETRQEFNNLLTLYEFDRIISKSNEFVNMIPSNPSENVTFQNSHMDNLKSSSKDNLLNIPETLIYDSNKMLNVQQLEMALHYLGINATEDQHKVLRDTLVIDDKGMVLYEEFVRIAKDIFKKELDDYNIKSLDNKDNTTKKDNNNYLFEENKRLKLQLEERNDLITKLEEKLHLEQRLLSTREDEMSALKCRLATLRHANQQAQDVESDYEIVIDSLQKKLTTISRRNGRGNLQMSSGNEDDYRKKLAVLSCELRKSQRLQNTYQVVSDKLFDFVENVRAQLKSEFKKSIPLSAGSLVPKMSTPQTSFQHIRLIEDSSNILITVKQLFDNDVLPFGWEEAYTSDGTKHYINHVTQITTWQHPLSKMVYKSRPPD